MHVVPFFFFCLQFIPRLPHRAPPPRRLQDQPGPGSLYDDVTAIFRLPNGGTFYIGNIRAAANQEILEKVNPRLLFRDKNSKQSEHL